MTDTEDTKQISVAELLARNGNIGAPASTRRRRRRRGDDSVSVAELTGEIPVVRDDRHGQEPPAPKAAGPSVADPVWPSAEVRVAEPTPTAEPPAKAPAKAPEPARFESEGKATYWAEPEPRWPKSESAARRTPGPQRSEYPRPLRQASAADDVSQSGAEHMSPDPVGHYTDSSVDVMDSEVREPESVVEDSAYVRSYLHGPDDSTADGTLFGGQSIADEVARRGREPVSAESSDDDEHEDEDDEDRPSKLTAVGRGLLVALQSILAVVFGAGLFVAFEELWRWDAIVALVLSVLVILGLVVAVRVVRKTEDIASTLIAVAVGALITLGPMALLQTS
ncbi:hypothetical protein [Mycobacterium vicinigordonae]|uniref:Transmembrane protein n=1 Tax=Mycobacterium vicinigordonae TaxID=1719132 RepID=A0A7D6E6X4_9MYCO|nr:hypothetical protein [Mycobacterium vicinigordonae]QLL08183.1 hypothetical protein H0P51_04195 [Mycobacterium vicinigordonae]